MLGSATLHTTYSSMTPALSLTLLRYVNLSSAYSSLSPSPFSYSIRYVSSVVLPVFYDVFFSYVLPLLRRVTHPNYLLVPQVTSDLCYHLLPGMYCTLFHL